MKKFVMIAAVFLFIASAFAITETQELTVNIEKLEVAYIYEANAKIDNNVVNFFEELGMNVNFVNSKNAKNTNFDQYDLLYINDENFGTNAKFIPVNEMPSVIGSYHNSDVWGLTDRDGASQMGSTTPLTVIKDSTSIQVYTQAYKIKKTAVPYYYLNKDNKPPTLIQIAATKTTSNGVKFGDVIAYANAGSALMNGKTAEDNICYYGIIASDFWTPQAKDLLEDCIWFALS